MLGLSHASFNPLGFGSTHSMTSFLSWPASRLAALGDETAAIRPLSRTTDAQEAAVCGYVVD
jgi:hypothetical protein